MPGQQLVNPSITSPRMGDRSKASRVSPRNMTGQRFAQQHAEHDAKKAAAANHDIETVRAAALQRGIDAGYDAGYDAAIALLEQAGFITYDRATDAFHRLTDAEYDVLPDEATE